MPSIEWPTSPLGAVDRAFNLLVVPPTPMWVDGRCIPGLPQRPIGLGELRDLLLSERVGRVTRDAVWRLLVARARGDGPAWVVAAAGVALPGLWRASRLLRVSWRGDRDELDAELLAGFVARIGSIDLESPRVCGRLIDAGIRAARRWRDADLEAQELRAIAAGAPSPARPWDHADLVLARAVAAGVIDAADANLIAVTRLEKVTVAAVADAAGVDVEMLRSRRRRAERRLADAIYAGELAFVPLRARRLRPAVGSLLGGGGGTGAQLGGPGEPLVGSASAGSPAGAGVAGDGVRLA